MGEMERLDRCCIVGVEHKPDSQKSLQDQQYASAASKYVCFVPNPFGSGCPCPAPFSVSSLVAFPPRLRRWLLFPPIQSLRILAVAVWVRSRLYDSIKLVRKVAQR